MTKRPEGLIYAVDEAPPWRRLLLLGIQYTALIAVTLVLIVIVMRAGGASHRDTVSAVSLGMIANAIGLLSQAFGPGHVGSGWITGLPRPDSHGRYGKPVTHSSYTTQWDMAELFGPPRKILSPDKQIKLVAGPGFEPAARLLKRSLIRRCVSLLSRENSRCGFRKLRFP